MVGAVFSRYIVDDLAPAFNAEVNVDIRHGDALRVQKALKKEAVFDRVDIRNLKTVGNYTSCRRAAPGADRYALCFGVADKVRGDEKIVREAHIANHIKLVI